jgi:fumarate reductase flavoprotein subunit
LAEALGISVETLEATALRFAGFLSAGQDQDFARPLNSALLPLDGGPYYGIPRWPAVHFTVGGLHHTQARVIDIKGAVIPFTRPVR